MENKLIVVKQLPIIEEHLKALSEDIESKVNKAMSLVCTEDTVKDIKTTRATLNAQFKELEEQRKLVKTAVLEPYEAFENIYKQCVSNKFKAADIDLKKKIDEVEIGLKNEKASKVSTYFLEYAKSKNIDFLQPADAKINITLSESLKSLKARVKEFIDRISDDLALIETQECKSEILVEYKKTLNCSQAITTVVSRHEAIERQKKADEEAAARKKELEEKQKERIAEIQRIKAEKEAKSPEPISAPVEIAVEMQKKAVQAEKIFTLSFSVKGTKEQLKELKYFLENGGYDYE